MSRKRRGQSGAGPAGWRAKRGITEVEPPLTPDSGLLRIALFFVLIYAVLQSILWAVGYFGYLDPVMAGTASVTGVCSSLTGVPATVSGNQIFLATRTLRIDPDCTAIAPILIFVALVLAHPASPRHKLIGVLVGVPALLLVNLARLIAVAQLSAPLADKAFFFVHDYLFKIAMVVAVMAAWGIYLMIVGRRHAS